MGSINDHNITVFKESQDRIKEVDSLQKSIENSIKLQEFIKDDKEVTFTEKSKKGDIYVTHEKTMKAAADYARNGKKVAVLNFASATTPGGGVLKGSSAQEECLCRVSTLYNCINDEEMWNVFYNPHRKSGDSIHNDDIIYTPGVKVIKTDDYDDLSEDRIFTVDVISCAAPNLRDKPANEYNAEYKPAPKISNEDLKKVHMKRAEKIFSVAAAKDVDVIIVGAFGCGAFRNPPEVVADAYKEVLPKYRNCFDTIEFAIFCGKDQANYDAFSESLNSLGIKKLKRFAE